MHPYINIHIHIRRTYKVDECIYIYTTNSKQHDAYILIFVYNRIIILLLFCGNNGIIHFIILWKSLYFLELIFSVE